MTVEVLTLAVFTSKGTGVWGYDALVFICTSPVFYGEIGVEKKGVEYMGNSGEKW